MHEIAAVVHLIVEKEYNIFKKFRHYYDQQDVVVDDTDDVVDDVDDYQVQYSWFTDDEDFIEAHTYYLFDKIMKSIDVIYSSSCWGTSKEDQSTTTRTTTTRSEHDLEDINIDNKVNKRITMTSYLEYIQGMSRCCCC